ncbi:MAG: T9SS type A sorting domain-containing protein [Fluviicola sp.]|nr:T9SS type A sorting domain-containing protein [Fluviicola sp.]
MNPLKKTLFLVFCLLFFNSLNAQSFLWAKGIGTTGVDQGTKVKVDAAGNVYTTGFYIGTADFNPGAGVFNMTSNTTTWYDVFITKFDASGNFIWAKSIGGSLNDVPLSLELDNSNNLLISGYFYGTVDFDPNAGVTNLVSAGNEEPFVLKLTDQGNFVWARRLGGAQNERANGVAIDANDNVYVTGVFSVAGDFDPGAATVTLTPVGGQDCFIVKLDAAGVFVWAKQLGGTGNEIGASIDIDAANNVITTGYFTLTADFDPGAGVANSTSLGLNDMFINKLDQNGAFIFNKTIEGASEGYFNTVKTDANNNIVAVGYFTGAIDSDPGAGVATMTSLGGNDGFLIQLNSAGNFVWAYQLASASGENYNDLAFDSNNNIYAVGTFSGTIDFDPGAGVFNVGSNGFEDGFIQKLNSSGGFISAWKIGGPLNYDRIYGVDVSLDGLAEIHTTGYYNATVDMDPSAGVLNLTAVGSSDIFVHKMGCAIPAAPASTTSLSICAGNSTTLTATGAGTLGWYTASTGGSYLGGGATYNTGNLNTTTTYYVQDSTCLAGPRTQIVVTVNDGVANQTLAAASSTVCPGSSTTINMGNSELGVNYYLRNNATDAIIQGPVAGTGGPLAFNTGALAATTSYNVFGTNSFFTNSALNLDGTNDYVTMGTGNRGITSTITVSARVKTVVNGASQFIVDKYLSGGIGYYLFINATGQASFQGRDVAGAIKSSGLSTTIVADNQWHDITGVVRSTGWEIWVDGVLESSGTYSLGGTGLGTTAALLVGQFNAAYTPADIDRVAIWNTALSPATILSNNATCLVGNEANLVALFTFNQTSGTNVPDLSPSATNGTLVNMSSPSCWYTLSGDYCQTTCDAEMSQIVTVTVSALPSQPTISAGGPTSLCSGGSVTLTASTGTTYLWSNGATTASIVVSTAGTYTVQVTNAAGCQSVASAGTTVIVGTLPAQPTVTAGGSTTFCAGGSVTLTSSAGTSYLWSNGATTAAISPTTSGTYTVQVTNASGCQSVASAGTAVTVNAVPSQPTISAGGSTTFCAGGSVTLTSSAGTSYLWSNGATTAAISPTTAGTFTVQVTNAAGCQSVASAGTAVTVNALPSQPTISAGGSTTFCTGGSVTLTSSAGTSYLWSNGATTASISPTTAGNYTVQVTNAAGCQSVASAGTAVTVNALPSQPTISAGGSTTFCAGGSVTLTSSAGTSYLWSNGATTAAISPTTAGNYIVQVTNAAGCQSVASTGTAVTVNALPSQPTITAGGATTFCSGGSVTLTSSAGSSYLWSDGSLNSSINPSSSGTYTVQVTNAAGCQSVASASTVVTVNSLPSQPTISASGATTFCAGGSVTLTSAAGSSYLWSNGATTASIAPTTTGTFTVQVTNASGCQSVSSAATTVTVNALPVIAQGSLTNPTSCTIDNGSIEITGTGNGDVSWTGTSSGSLTGITLPATITNLSDGSFNITFTNASGCVSNTINSSLIAPSAPAAPTITASGATTFCAGGSVTLTSSNGSAYLWSNGETTASIQVSDAGSYTVSITDASGCSSAASSGTAVTLNALPVIAAGTVTNPTSCTVDNGSIEVTGTGTGDLSWTGTASGSSTAITLPSTINGLGDGSYDITFTDALGCTSLPLSASLSLPGTPSAPIISASGATTFCEGGSVTLTSSNGTSYLWSNGATTASIDVVADGSYTVIITNVDGCTSPASATTTVAVDQLPDVTVTEVNNTITATQTGAAYQWIDCGNGNQPIAGATGIAFSPTVNGSYAVIITSGTCSDTSACTIISTIGLSEQTSVFIGVHPNPGFDVVEVTASSNIQFIEIYAATGELIRLVQEATFDISNMARGIYLLKVTTNQGTGMVRLVKE